MTAPGQTLCGKRFLIHGKVQGVSYRYYLQQQAQKLALAGWCRNLPGGQVEAAVYGPASQIELLQAWCYQGSPLAEVTEIEVEPLPLQDVVIPHIFEIYR